MKMKRTAALILALAIATASTFACAAGGGTAVSNTVSVSVDGCAVQFPMYKLVDENGNDTNYVRLRDLAAQLNGTAASFEIIYVEEYDAITLLPGQRYYEDGSEMKAPFVGDREYAAVHSTVYFNGEVIRPEGILLSGPDGDYNYYKLRDLGRAMGFNVGYSNENGIFIETNKPYTDAD